MRQLSLVEVPRRQQRIGSGIILSATHEYLAALKLNMRTFILLYNRKPSPSRVCHRAVLYCPCSARLRGSVMSCRGGKKCSHKKKAHHSLPVYFEPASRQSPALSAGCQSPTNHHEPPIDSKISVKLFRPDENAKRIRASAERILMEPPPADLFIKACKMAVKVSRFFRRKRLCTLLYADCIVTFCTFFKSYCFGSGSIVCESAPCVPPSFFAALSSRGN